MSAKRDHATGDQESVALLLRHIAILLYERPLAMLRLSQSVQGGGVDQFRRLADQPTTAQERRNEPAHGKWAR